MGDSPEAVGTEVTPLRLRLKWWYARHSYQIRSRLSRFLLELAFKIGDRESKLVKHAENELRRAGMYDKDADYGGMLPQAVLDLVRIHSLQGHSGFSHSYTLMLFNKVVNFQVLTPITDDPNEWTESNFGGTKQWQNNRQFSCFSEDGGKTYYDNNEKPTYKDDDGCTYTKSSDKPPIHTSKPHKGEADAKSS